MSKSRASTTARREVEQDPLPAWGELDVPCAGRARAPRRSCREAHRSCGRLIEPGERERRAQPARWHAGADYDARRGSALVEVGEHVELQQQDLRSAPVVRCDVRRIEPAARVLPAARRDAAPFAAFPERIQPGRRVVGEEPLQRLPRAIGAAEEEPLVRLGDVEVGPERRFAEAAARRALLGPASIELALVRGGRLRRDEALPQPADVRARIARLRRGQPLLPGLPTSVACAR